MGAKSEELIKVFEDTKAYTDKEGFESDSITYKATLKANSGAFGISAVVRDKPCNIEVINSDTVSAIVKHVRDGDHVCALNMASAKRAGGGVASGSKAQEECLFRCSNLFDAISQDWYPLEEDVCLYTQTAVFFKDVHYNIMEEVICDIVTVPAINLNKGSHYDSKKNEYVNKIDKKPKNYEQITKDKIRLMLTEARENFVDTVILGAWGCGVFKNNPTEMATMFKEVLVDEDYQKWFKNVIFAIINDRNSVANNYDLFKKVLI